MTLLSDKGARSTRIARSMPFLPGLRATFSIGSSTAGLQDMPRVRSRRERLQASRCRTVPALMATFGDSRGKTFLSLLESGPPAPSAGFFLLHSG